MVRARYIFAIKFPSEQDTYIKIWTLSTIIAAKAMTKHTNFKNKMQFVACKAQSNVHGSCNSDDPTGWIRRRR
jgi:hypothetical protein